MLTIASKVCLKMEGIPTALSECKVTLILLISIVLVVTFNFYFPY